MAFDENRPFRYAARVPGLQHGVLGRRSVLLRADRRPAMKQYVATPSRFVNRRNLWVADVIMRIVMMTNTYLPHVGGVARSVALYTQHMRALGHDVLVVAPRFEGAPKHEPDVVRLPAVQHFNGSDFAVVVPVPVFLRSRLHQFRPQLVHSHHPFLLGNSAVRVAAAFHVPLVFTHHTMYEDYTHYVPVHASALRQFVIDLSVGYANLCDQVIAPSKSIERVLRQRGVETPIESIPTGVEVDRYADGAGDQIRRRFGVPDAAFVVGYVGRLAPEKNLAFLSQAVVRFCAVHNNAVFLVVGRGPEQARIEAVFDKHNVRDRLRCTGALEGQDLVDAYHAMDLFAFASRTETQGMVIAEAMAASTPVVALDGSGVRDIVRNDENGWLLKTEDTAPFSEALERFARLDQSARRSMCRHARQTADEYSMEKCCKRVLDLYQRLLGETPGSRDEDPWTVAMERIKAEWDLLSNLAGSIRRAVSGEPDAGGT